MFYLGVGSRPRWLAETDIPLFLSRRQLARVRTLPRARGTWALDSGGFTEIHKSGGYPFRTDEYAAEVKRYAEEIGGLEWAACMDFMCEPSALKATGFGVETHQEWTVDNYVDLRGRTDLAIPVLQGWTQEDYLEHVEMYARRGVDLRALPVVGIGSVCRRQDTYAAEHIVRSIAALGIKLHAFGAKIGGVVRYRDVLVSADSQSWSVWAWRDGTRADCPDRRKSCTNCLHYAITFYDRVMRRVAAPEQMRWA